MADIRRAKTIAAPVDAVWTVLADFGGLSSWAPNVDHSCLLDGSGERIAAGTSRRVQIGRNALVERITEAVAPVSLSYDIEGLPRALRHVANRWELRPAGDGRTEVMLTSTVSVGGNPVARLAEKALCAAMARQSESMLAGLARRCEQTDTAGTTPEESA